MTKAFPNIIIKESEDSVDMGLKGGPVKPIKKSWRERSGQRRTFGAPSGGWPEFSEEGKMVKRRTDPSGPETDMATPKGYAMVCFKCAKDAGLDEDFNITISSHVVGMCDICGSPNVGRMGIEAARYAKLLEDIGLDGETSDG